MTAVVTCPECTGPVNLNPATGRPWAHRTANYDGELVWCELADPLVDWDLPCPQLHPNMACDQFDMWLEART